MAKGLWIWLVIIAVVLIAAVYFAMNGINKSSSQTSTPASNVPSGSLSINNIEIKSFAFFPLTLTIKKGGAVTWTNKDIALHTVTSDAGDELASGTLSNGESYTHTFNEIGAFNYYCKIHPSMKGKMVVE